MKQEGTAILYMFNNQSFMYILKVLSVFFLKTSVKLFLLLLCYYVIAPECYTVCYRVELFRTTDGAYHLILVLIREHDWNVTREIKRFKDRRNIFGGMILREFFLPQYGNKVNMCMRFCHLSSEGLLQHYQSSLGNACLFRIKQRQLFKLTLLLSGLLLSFVNLKHLSWRDPVLIQAPTVF